MGHFETGNLEVIFLIGSIFFGVLGVLSTAVWAWLYNLNSDILANDDTKTRNTKLKRIARKYIAGYAAIANFTLCVAYVFLLAKVGTYHRECDDIRVNWSFFAFNVVTFVAVGMTYTVFFWLEGIVHRTVFSSMLALSMGFLSLAVTSCEGSKRNASYSMAIVFQGLAVVFLAVCTRWGGPLMRRKGWLMPWATAFAGLAGLALLDTFWYIGFENQSAKEVLLPSPWKSYAPFLAGVFLVVAVSQGLAFYFYTIRKANNTTTGGVTTTSLSGAAARSADEIIANEYAPATAAQMQSYA
jgi:hypothetical protein